MRSRIIAFVGLTLLSGVLAPGTTATMRAGVVPVRQWAIVDFAKTTEISGRLLSPGRYLIAHDFEKMARGEPCTTFYTFGESGNGPQEDAVSFHCIPVQRNMTDETSLTLTTVSASTGGCTFSWSWQVDRLTEYQFAGDTEGHGVPESESAEHLHP